MVEIGSQAEVLSLCIEHCPAPIAVLDRSLRYVAVSRRWLRDFKLEGEVVGRAHEEVFPDLPERWKKILHRCLSGGVEHCDEDVFPRADGSIEYLRWEVHPWHSAQGENCGIIIFSELLTAGRKVETELRQSEERLRLSIRAAELGTWHWNLQTGELVWSERSLAMFGIPPGTAMSYERFEQALHPEDRARVRALVQKAIQERREYDVELRAVWPDDSIHWIASKGRAFYGQDGDPLRMEGIALDVTPRKLAEKSLRESEQHLRNALERLHVALQAAGMGTVVWEVATDRMHFDDALLHLTGRTREEVERGRAAFVASLVHPEDREYVSAALAAALKHGNGLQIEHRIVRPDGEVVWVARKSRVERDATGKPVRMIGAVMDITARKRLEQEMLQGQRLDAIGQLASGVAHDFNNNLTVILGHADLLSKREKLDRGAVRSVQEIMAAAERASRLTAQLLAFAQRQAVQLQDLDLNEPVRTGTEMLERTLGENILLRRELAATPIVVRADPNLVMQILVNLAVNAREAMPRGGELTIRTSSEVLDPEHAVSIPHAIAGAWGCFTVSDTGQGMTPEVQSRAFEPFFTTKSGEQSAGLGLSSVYGIVQQLRGWVSLTSEPGRGSTFCVRLPLSQAVAPRKPSQSPHAVPRGRGECILLVEDEFALCGLMAEALERSGYRVITAQNGPEALQVWREHGSEIALVFSDIRMPGGVSGLELAERLRAEAPVLPILLTSGHGSLLADQTLASGQHAAFDDFLPKPYNVETLLRVIRDLLDARH